MPKSRRRFLFALPRRDEPFPCPPLDTIDTLDTQMPVGTTAPAQTCQPDSVLALVCPKCEEVWYIPLGLYRHLFQANHVADALLPGVFNWLNARHVPCDAIMNPVPLTDEGKLIQEQEGKKP